MTECSTLTWTLSQCSTLTAWETKIWGARMQWNGAIELREKAE